MDQIIVTTFIAAPSLWNSDACLYIFFVFTLDDCKHKQHGKTVTTRGKKCEKNI